MPPPAIPSRGRGPSPKIRAGESGMSTTAPTHMTTAGRSMFPVPRIAAARELNSQTRIAPAKIVLE
jgi:hypothetical protein